MFGAPFCGGAPVALSFIARERGLRCTLFYACRAVLHPRQLQAQSFGARLEFVKPGYMTVVQKRARDYAAAEGAAFFPLGFDLPEARLAYEASIRKEWRGRKNPPQVWCAMGSGMLAQALARAFPSSEIHAVAVGLASRWRAQDFPPNVRTHEQPLRFEQPERKPAPFPSCPNYDRKAWHLAVRLAAKGSLFWNVLGD